ncbi:hypothetical protein B0H14DRAFT_3031547, partial [Mycena olivaceomarginata]
FDLGEPIICGDFDLEDALKRENEARMARETSHLDSREEDPDVVRTTQNEAAPQALTRDTKKKAKKRARDRAQRQADAVQSQSAIEPPLPTPRMLQKAAESEPISTTFSAQDFRATTPLHLATKPRWTGLQTPVEHPLLAHANDPAFLKRHMRFIDWKGDKCRLILDRKGRIIGILVPPPVSPDQWAPVVEAATAAMRAACEKMSFPAHACRHRRGNFPAEHAGFAFSTGRQTVGNIKRRSQRNAKAMDELLADKSIGRMAAYPIPVFQTACFNIFSDYHQTKQALLKKNPYLHRTFPRSPFSAVTVNLGPASVSPPHTDGGNKADGMCLIGGHLVCWDYNLIICFPAGCSALIPSAVRYLLIQYSAGSLFRWVANGHQSDLDWYGSATPEDIAQREEDRKARCATALKKFTLWKDLKVKNFSGRSRVEVWDEGDVADFSDLTEESEGEQPPPKKKARRC